MTLQVHLNAYCHAFNGRALNDTTSLFAEHALFEMPLLGQRLFGKGEIQAGLECMFDLTEVASIEITAVKESRASLIAEGKLTAKLRRDSAPVDIPLAIALEAKDGKISRLSTYLDARPYRLWSDGMIFAHPSSASN